MTLKDAIELLRESGISSAASDARELFRHFDKRDIGYLLLNPELTASEECEAAVRRRAKREPLQYIIGEVAFYNELYEVSPDCLIPRSDTEILVEYATKNIPDGESFCDICTGSGCIAVSTLKNTVGTTAHGIDISEGALALARKNAKKNGVSERLLLSKTDILTDKTIEFLGGTFFAVLANPPYIREEVYATLEPELFLEPKIALVAENGGAIFYERLVPLGLLLIKKGGFVALEIGYDQGELLRSLAAEHGADIEILKDYSNNDRVAVLRRR